MADQVIKLRKFAKLLGAELWTYRKKTSGGKTQHASSQEILVIGAFVPIEEYKNTPQMLQAHRPLSEIKETTESSKFKTTKTV